MFLHDGDPRLFATDLLGEAQLVSIAKMSGSEGVAEALRNYLTCEIVDPGARVSPDRHKIALSLGLINRKAEGLSALYYSELMRAVGRHNPLMLAELGSENGFTFGDTDPNHAIFRDYFQTDVIYLLNNQTLSFEVYEPDVMEGEAKGFFSELPEFFDPLGREPPDRRFSLSYHEAFTDSGKSKLIDWWCGPSPLKLPEALGGGTIDIG